MTASVKAVPEGLNSVIPSLTCNDANAAIDFYKKVFGATVKVSMPGPGGKVMHAEVVIHGTMFFVNDSMDAGDATESKSQPVQLYMYVEDPDAVSARALGAGARTTLPLQDMFWGDRFGKFTDPAGHEWGVLSHVEDVAPEEMMRRQKEFMAKAAGQQ
jgi:PhnB protein